MTTSLSFLIFVSLPYLYMSEIRPDGRVVMCLVSATSVYIEEPAKYDPRYLEANLCTHLVYYRFTVDQSTSRITPAYPDADGQSTARGMLKELVKLKKVNPGLRVLGYVGGWKEPSSLFSDLTQSQARRMNFINSALETCKTENLDGIMIYWEHPGLNGGKPEDKQNYPTLLEEMKKVFSSEGLQLVVEVRARRYILEAGYDVGRIEKTVDYIVARLHSLHSYKHSTTRPSAPLSSSDELNVGSGVELLLSAGVPASKLVLGMSTFGEMYLTEEPVPQGQYKGVRTKAKGSSAWTHSNYIGYNEVLFLLSSGQWKQYWDEASSTPFAVGNQTIITYDDKRSLVEKAKIVVNKGLGGVCLEKLENDDFKGFFEGVRYPLVRAVRSHLEGSPGGIHGDLSTIKVTNHYW